MKTNRITRVGMDICICLIGFYFVSCQNTAHQHKNVSQSFDVPEGYFDQADSIPGFWLSTVDEINTYLHANVKKGKVETVGTSAGGHPIYAVSYGESRQESGTTTFSGTLSMLSIAHYRGKDADKKVYMGIAGVHGFELEGIVGVLNMIEVLETGKDLKGKPWPYLAAMLENIDRIILMPLVNPDGRARVPVRMEKHRGGDPDSYIIHEYLNTGGNKEGGIIGWPDVKAFIPMDFSSVGFPGGYPNDAGFNIMHDDFFGELQPETKVLFDITGSEKPDLIINMHTGVDKSNYFMTVHRPFSEPKLQPVFDTLYRQIKTALVDNRLQGTTDLAMEADPSDINMSSYNLNTALNLHCGALTVVIESPCHGFSGTDRSGNPIIQTPEMLVDAQLVAHEGALDFLLEQGGRTQWEKMISQR